jgi:glutathione S-transferase
MAALVRRGIRRALHAQGFGRHAPREIYALGAADLLALATIIAPQRFAVANHPTSCDATLFGFLANILLAPAETELTREARRHPALTSYVERMRDALAQTGR